jgi:hypothetical protein
MRVLATLLIVLALFAGDSRADVDVIRGGAENPVVTIAKSTFWGGLTGLVLGGAIALVVDDNQEDIVKWSFVAGVFGGFAFGVYHVATRPSPESSLLQIDDEGLALNIPAAQVVWSGDRGARSVGAKIALFSYQF